MWDQSDLQNYAAIIGPDGTSSTHVRQAGQERRQCHRCGSPTTSVRPSLPPSSGFVPLTIWLPSAAFQQVGPVASFGQRPAKVAHPPPTLQIKVEKRREEDKQLFD